MKVATFDVLDVCSRVWTCARALRVSVCASACFPVWREGWSVRVDVPLRPSRGRLASFLIIQIEPPLPLKNILYTSPPSPHPPSPLTTICGHDGCLRGASPSWWRRASERVREIGRKTERQQRERDRQGTAEGGIVRPEPSPTSSECDRSWVIDIWLWLSLLLTLVKVNLSTFHPLFLHSHYIPPQILTDWCGLSS